MGSWSVYCEMSNITITSGTECVLIPLMVNDRGETNKWAPATLPIFGKYDDYGGIEDIEENLNTKQIEKHYGVSIEEFCTFLIDGKHTYDREEAQLVAGKLKFVKQAEEIRYMWMDREVYDLMAQSLDVHDRGHLDFGTETFLKLLGFKRNEKLINQTGHDPNRYNQCWERDGEVFTSDGKTLNAPNGNHIFYVGGKNHSDEWSLDNYIEIPENFKFLYDCNKSMAWRVSPEEDAQQHFAYLFGLNWTNRRYASLLGNKEDESLVSEYLENLDMFGDTIAGLMNIQRNGYAMSKGFSPMKMYLTPQCGEHRTHQKLLDGFAKINRGHLEEEELEELV